MHDLTECLLLPGMHVTACSTYMHPFSHLRWWTEASPASSRTSCVPSSSVLFTVLLLKPSGHIEGYFSKNFAHCFPELLWSITKALKEGCAHGQGESGSVWYACAALGDLATSSEDVDSLEKTWLSMRQLPSFVFCRAQKLSNLGWGKGRHKHLLQNRSLTTDQS